MSDELKAEIEFWKYKHDTAVRRIFEARAETAALREILDRRDKVERAPHVLGFGFRGRLFHHDEHSNIVHIYDPMTGCRSQAPLTYACRKGIFRLGDRDLVFSASSGHDYAYQAGGFILLSSVDASAPTCREDSCKCFCHVTGAWDRPCCGREKV
jgi:hypothetical protein